MKILSLFLEEIKKRIPYLTRIFGVRLLNQDQTRLRLEEWKLFCRQSESSILPGSLSYGGIIEDFKKEELAETSTIEVYCIENVSELEILSYGGVKLGCDILDLNFGSSEYLRTAFTRNHRTPFYCENCIILWSHRWGGGYYDYLILIYSKLLRIKSVIGEDAFNNSKIVYPIFGYPFEIELLSYAGVQKDQLLDTREFNVKANKNFVATNQNWFYPHPYDISLLKETSKSVAINNNIDYERIYISRKGRRRLLNESQIIEVLKEYGFKVVEDIHRPVSEQMMIYANAKIIVGPHGASFTNILWCKPKTILVELFAHNYYPPYFRYLASILDLEYVAIIEKNVSQSHYSHLGNDIFIDPLSIRNALKGLLKTRHQ